METDKKATPDTGQDQPLSAHGQAVKDEIAKMHKREDRSPFAGGPAKDGPDPMLQWFEYDHLPEELKAISAPFGALAAQLVNLLPRNPERTVALRKLLEAKDCAVRAKLFVA